MFHTRRYVPFGGKRRPKPSACRSGGSALGFALSGRSKIGPLRRKNTRRLGCGGSANSTLSGRASGRRFPRPRPGGGCAGARFLGLSFSAANDNADFLPSKTELTRKYSNPLFVFHSASSRTEPPALRNFSISPAARLSRIASRIVQRLSKVCSSMRGCCSLTTRMMAFIAT